MKVIFYGGRQALALALAYMREAPDSKDAGYIGNPLDPSPGDTERLRGADRIVAVESGARPLDAEALELSAEIVRLPELHCEWLWPFGGQPHAANTLDELSPDGPFPAEHGDAWLNRALEGPQRPEAVEAAYLALDVARAVDLNRMRDLSLARQAELDKAYGVDFAPRIAAASGAPAPFLSPRTPGPALFDALAQTAFARLGLPPPAAKGLPLDARELPIHPRVAQHFRLDWAVGRACTGPWGGPMDFAEYVRRYLAFAEGPELERGLALLAAGQGEAAATLLEIAAARPMGRRSQGARLALAHASVLALSEEARRTTLGAFARGDVNDADFLSALAAYARGRLPQAERALMAYLRRAPDDADLYATLAAIRDRRGDGEGALAALELALGLRPGDPRLQSRLTMALAARGDVVGAVRSAEAETAFDPTNPHPQAYLAQLLVNAGWRERAAPALDRALALIGDAPDLAGLRASLAQARAGL